MTEFETLWNRLLEHLDREGLLSIQAAKLTPAEIARHVFLRTGDQRVQKFVWGYYYPLTYGNVPGALSSKKARAIVASFEKTSTVVDVPPAKYRFPAPRRCDVCGVRWPATEEVTSK